MTFADHPRTDPGDGSTVDAVCGMLQPTGDAHRDMGLRPYRCSRPAGHEPPHAADVDGETVATWTIPA